MNGFSGTKETKLPEQMVDKSGYISVPFVGKLNVIGKTPQQVQDMIIAGLRKKANQPSAIVRITKNNSADVTVIGEVNNSTRMPLVDSFAELGKYLYEPVKVYSSGMRARLAFAISMAVDFDCYLIDEVISVGDAKFHQKCQEELFEKRAHKAMIIVSHELHNIRDHCDRVAILDKGRIFVFDDIDEAISVYNSL